MKINRSVCWTLLAVSPAWTPLLEQSPQPLPESTTLPTPPAPETPSIDGASVAEKMIAAVMSSPVLHLKVRVEFRGVVYDTEGWATAQRARGEVRKDGTLVFATYMDQKRIQEFARKVEFKNGERAENVLVEYDTGTTNAFDQWPRLIDHDFACGPGCTATGPWLSPQHPNVAEMIAETIRNADRSSVVTLGNRTCYLFHIEHYLDKDNLVVKDVYVDTTTFEPVRQATVNSRGTKVTKSNISDYTFDHLATDEGIEWRLDPAKLK